MKRTRRIEIIRYSRRRIVARGECPLVDTEGSLVIDLFPIPQEDTLQAPEGEDRRPATGFVELGTPQQTLNSRLRDLLMRLRW